MPSPNPIQLWYGARKPTRLFFFTKASFPDFIGYRFLFPDHWFAIQRYSILTPEAFDALHFLVEGFQLPLVFVGDLRPIDLTTFALLRAGTTDFSRKRSKPLPVTYAGINDDWLALSDQYRLRGRKMLEYPMNRWERGHLALLHELVPDLPQLVGERSWALLQASQQVFLEMTYVSDTFRKGYPERLVAHLDAIAARVSRGFRRTRQDLGRARGGR
jgi:hypothetical protein